MLFRAKERVKSKSITYVIIRMEEWKGNETNPEKYFPCMKLSLHVSFVMKAMNQQYVSYTSRLGWTSLRTEASVSEQRETPCKRESICIVSSRYPPPRVAWISLGNWGQLILLKGELGGNAKHLNVFALCVSPTDNGRHLWPASNKVSQRPGR